MKSLRLPPGPRGRELLAGLRILRQDPLAFLSACTNRYGDFVYLPLGVLNAYILNHPDAIQHVLLDNHRNYSKDTFQYNLLSTITGRGLLTSDGDFWLRQRRLAQPAFHKNRVLGLSEMMASATNRMMDGWEDGSIVDIDAELMRLTLEIIGKALFSVDLSAEAKELTQAVLTALDYLIYRSRSPFSPETLALPTRRSRHFRAALRTLDRAVLRLIQERRSGLLAEDAHGDLLSMLLNSRDPDTGAGMEDQQLRDEMITLLIAGHETVASALTWTCYLLLQHPHCADSLYAEVNQALAGRPPNASDLPNLPFTRQLFDEALRLYPPAWIITRKALHDDQIAGFQVKANSLLILSPYTIHRHPTFWENPDAFDPGHFPFAGPRFAYIPFGGGPRLCIGEGFARVEGRLILACLAQGCRFAPAPGQDVQVEALVTLRPRNGLKMTVHKIKTVR